MKFEALQFEAPCACITLRRAARAVTAVYDASLAPSGLRITQFSILRKLARFGPLPVTRLAAEAALDRSTMGRNLNPLERRGLVRIEVGNVDQRERVAYLTAAGAAAIIGTSSRTRRRESLRRAGGPCSGTNFPPDGTKAITSPTKDRGMGTQVVLITGGLTGIGRAAAIAFAKKGAKVVVAGRRDEAGKALVKELRSFGSEAEFINTDVRKEDDVRALVDKTVARFGRLDVAVNNAGTEGQVGPIADQTAESYAATFDTNVLGVILSEARSARHARTGPR